MEVLSLLRIIEVDKLIAEALLIAFGWLSVLRVPHYLPRVLNLIVNLLQVTSPAHGLHRRHEMSFFLRDYGGILIV